MSMQVKSINYCKHHLMEVFYVTLAEANLSEKYSCTICLDSEAAKLSHRAA